MNEFAGQMDAAQGMTRREACQRLAGGAAALAVGFLNDADAQAETNSHTMKERVLIIVGDVTETVDTLYPYYRLIEGGYEPVVAGPEQLGTFGCFAPSPVHHSHRCRPARSNRNAL